MLYYRRNQQFSNRQKLFEKMVERSTPIDRSRIVRELLRRSKVCPAREARIADDLIWCSLSARRSRVSFESRSPSPRRGFSASSPSSPSSRSRRGYNRSNRTEKEREVLGHTLASLAPFVVRVFVFASQEEISIRLESNEVPRCLHRS